MNPFLENLFKLSGMKYKQGYYTPEEWKSKTGIDPLIFYNYIIVNHMGLCYWSDKAESLYKDYVNGRANNWNSLGIN